MPDPRGRVSVKEASELPTYHQQEIPAEFLDEMGHMNVRWYVYLFSLGARGFFQTIGLPVEGVATRETGTFALKQYIEYHAEVHVGQIVRVHTRLIGFSAKRMHIMHFMVNQTTDRVAATMENLITHVDLTKRRSSPFPEDVGTKLSAISDGQEQLLWSPPLSGAISAD